MVVIGSEFIVSITIDEDYIQTLGMSTVFCMYLGVY